MDTKYISELAKKVVEQPNFVQAKENILQSIIDTIKDEPIDVNSCDSRLLLSNIKDLFYSSMNYELSKILLQWASYQGKKNE